MSGFRRLLAVFFFLFVFTSFAAAEVDTRAIAQTPLNFYKAIQAQNYIMGWNLLSEASKARISTVLAEDLKTTPQQARALIEADDARVRKGFWEPFRTAANVDIYLGFQYEYVGLENGVHLVRLSQPGAKDGKPSNVVVTEENGYKFGMVETYKF